MPVPGLAVAYVSMKLAVSPTTRLPVIVGELAADVVPSYPFVFATAVTVSDRAVTTCDTVLLLPVKPVPAL